MKFKSIKVSAVADPILGGTPKRSESRYWGGDIKWASAKDVAQTSSRYITETLETITEEGVKHSAAKVLPKDTIVITARGTVGEMRLLGQPMAFNQSCYGLVSKDNIDNMYLFYALKYITDSIKSASYGTVFDTITKKTFDLLKIPYPSYEEQIKFSSILDSLDRKIELNQKMNKTLEEMAMTLYKHWFVDFGPFQDGEFVESELGMIPKGWRVISCYDLANYINGKAFKTNQLVDNDGLPVIKIAELKSGITNSTKFYNGDIEPKYLLQNGDILFAWSASLGVFIWAKGKAVLNQHIFNVKPNGTLSKSMIYFTLKNIIQEFIEIAASRATTMGHITKEHLIDKKIALPPDELLVKVDEKMSNYYQMILSNMLEVERLTQIRDYLLPRLLSGEIDVSQAEKQVEEVL